MEEQFEGEMSARYSELMETKDLANNLVKQLQETKVLGFKGKIFFLFLCELHGPLHDPLHFPLLAMA